MLLTSFGGDDVKKVAVLQLLVLTFLSCQKQILSFHR